MSTESPVHPKRDGAESPQLRQTLELAELLLDIYEYRRGGSAREETPPVDEVPEGANIKRERSTNEFALG
jgi:hypothetical protein